MMFRNHATATMSFLLIAMSSQLIAQDTIACRKGVFNDPNIPVVRCGLEIPSVSNCATSGTCVPTSIQNEEGLWVIDYVCQGGESKINSPLYFVDEKSPLESTREQGGKAWSLHRRWCVRVFDCDKYCNLSGTTPPVCIPAGPNDQKSRYMDYFVPVRNNAGTQLDCPEPADQ